MIIALHLLKIKNQLKSNMSTANTIFLHFDWFIATFLRRWEYRSINASACNRFYTSVMYSIALGLTLRIVLAFFI